MSLSDSIGSLARSAALITAGSVVGRGLALLGETAIARQLQPAVYGDIALAYTIVAVLGSTLLLGIHEGVTRLGTATDDEGERTDLIIAAFLTATLSGVTGIGLVAFGSDIIATYMSNPEIRKYLLLVAPYLLLYPLSRIVIAHLRIQQRSATMIITRAIVARVVALVLLFGAAVLIGGPTVGVIYWLSVPFVIVLIGGALSIKRIKYRRVRLPPRTTFGELWSFSWPLAASSIVFLFLSQLDVLMIGYFLSSNEVGYYRAIQPLRQGAMIFLGSFSFLFMPLATQAFQNEEFEELDVLFGSVTKWAVVLTLPLISTFIFLPETVVVAFFGEPYISAAVPLSILSGGLFLRAVVGPNGDLVKAIDRPKVEAIASVVGVTGNFLLNLVLIPRYGIMGAAVATVVGYGVYNGVELAIIYREIGATPFSAGIAKTVLATFGTLWLVQMIFIASGLFGIVLFTVIAGVVTTICFVGTRSVEDSDMLLINKFERRTGFTLTRVRIVMRWGLSE